MSRTRWISILAILVVLLSAVGGTAAYQAFAAHASHHGHQTGHGHKKPTPQPKPPTPTPVPRGGNGPFTLIYSDNFPGTQLNPQWITYGGPYAIGDSAFDPNEITVSGGMAHIHMEKKTTDGKPYTTGGMGLMRLSQTYGKYVFRVRLPLGKGVGPYAILWPQASGHGDVEVDLFESPPPMKDKVYFTNHGNGQPTQIIAPGNFGAAFHTFSYEWTPGKIDFQIDGVEQGALTKNIPNFPMWFGLAVSSGDAFTGTPDNTTALPVSYDISQVQIYKYNG